MNNLDKQYTALLQDILDNGITKGDRTGVGTKSVFGRQIRHKMSEGFPLLTTKKMYWKGIVTELLWFLRGDTNIKYLVDNDCHIWDGDALKAYHKHEMNEFKKVKEKYPNRKYKFALTAKEEFINKIKTDDEFAKQWGSLGRIYGKQWRDWLNLKWEATDKVDPSHPNQPMMKWNIESIDQIQNLINDLKTNPDSRRLMVSAWNVGEIDSMVLPPCHYGFQVWTRVLSPIERWAYCEGKIDVDDPLLHEKLDTLHVPKRGISLLWNQRSVDTFLGLPFNIASYGLLLEILAKECNMIPDELIGNLGDTHIYLNHIDAVKEQIGRELSLEERKKMYEDEFTQGMEVKNDEWLESKLTTRNIPKQTREPYPLPTLEIYSEFWQTESGECGIGPLNTNLQGFEISDFVLENYQSHPAIKAPLNN